MSKVHVIVERRFPEPLSLAELQEVEKRMGSCLDLYRVRWLRSYWSSDRRRMICEYEAPDAGAVREVQNQAGASFESVWTADIREP
jgi:hypothetical protein